MRGGSSCGLQSALSLVPSAVPLAFPLFWVSGKNTTGKTCVRGGCWRHGASSCGRRSACRRRQSRLLRSPPSPATAAPEGAGFAKCCTHVPADKHNDPAASLPTCPARRHGSIRGHRLIVAVRIGANVFPGTACMHLLIEPQSTAMHLAESDRALVLPALTSGSPHVKTLIVGRTWRGSLGPFFRRCDPTAASPAEADVPVPPEWAEVPPPGLQARQRISAARLHLLGAQLLQQPQRLHNRWRSRRRDCRHDQGCTCSAMSKHSRPSRGSQPCATTIGGVPIAGCARGATHVSLQQGSTLSSAHSQEHPEPWLTCWSCIAQSQEMGQLGTHFLGVARNGCRKGCIHVS